MGTGLKNGNGNSHKKLHGKKRATEKAGNGKREFVVTAFIL